MEFEFMDSVSYCDSRIDHILYSNMWMLTLMIGGLGFVAYQYGKLEEEYRKYKESVESAQEEEESGDESGDEESSEETGNESEEDNETDVVKDEEVEGVKTRSWFS
mgnify:CR=1 FL=1